MINDDDSSLLIEAASVFGAVRGFIRQSFGADFDPADIPSASMRQALAQAAGTTDIATLELQLLRLQEQVKSVYIRIIEDAAEPADEEQETS